MEQDLLLRLLLCSLPAISTLPCLFPHFDRVLGLLVSSSSRMIFRDSGGGWDGVVVDWVNGIVPF